MSVYAHLSAFLSLVALTAGGPVIPGCTYNGQSYPNLAIIPHINDCAKLQCQFGQFVTYYESCNKDIDGTCHRLNFQFVHDGATYECTKVQMGDGFEYQYKVEEPKIKDCVFEGKTYSPLEKYKGQANCQEYQCQNGVNFPLDPVCSSEIDGTCHLVGQTFEKNGKTYTCTLTKEGGQNIYENKITSNTVGSRTCTAGGKTFQHLEVFRLAGSCNLRQCQDHAVKFLTQSCIFKPDESKCFAAGEQWIFQEKTFECTPNEDGTVKYEIRKKAYEKCKRSEKWYGHLEVHTREDGCTSVQCQNGKTPPVEEGCLYNVDNKCYSLNMVFEQKGVNMKCVLTGDGLYRIFEVDNKGQIVEKVPTVTAAPDFGISCPRIKADIIFVWDSSGSISSANYQRQQNFSCNIVSAFQIGPDNVRVGGIIFSKDAEKVFDLNSYDTQEDICKAIKRSPFLGDITETQKAFNMLVEKEMFAEKHGGRPDAMDVVIVITDGASTNTAITLAAVDRYKASSGQVICIGVGKISESELLGMASSPQNVFNTKSYEAIFALKSEISKRTCDVPTEPPEPPIDPTLTECPKAVADLIIILDSTSSDEKFKFLSGIACNITTQLVINKNSVQVSLVSINSQATNHFDLNTYSTRTTAVQAVRGVTNAKGSRNTHNALDNVYNGGLYTADHGGRNNAARVAVILLDGPSADLGKTLPLAKKLRNDGVRIVSLGINEFDRKELNGLSGNPDYVFAAQSLEMLSFVKGQFYKKICEATSLPRPGIEPPRCSDTVVPPCAQECENTETAYKCSCLRGFVINKSNPAECDDVNECTGTVPCEQTCVNTPGSFQCACREGYVVNPDNPYKCIDIDECAENRCEHFCENTDGSYKCTCKEGYKVNPSDPSKCQDIDECATLSPCQQTCTNTESGYSCSCKAGYVVSAADPTRCTDIDECEGSPCQHTCKNGDGTFECSCRPGYVVSPTDPTKCDDVDECTTEAPCQHSCTNTDGSYECTCNKGFVVNAEDPKRCDDIDECTTEAPCQHTCTNTDGSYECTCKKGFVVNAADPTRCDDVDECQDSPCQQLCANDDGDFQCSCKPGYVINSEDPTKCDDVDECAKDAPCQHKCTNTDGSYECSCQTGYVVSSSDPHKCDDVDECTEGSPCQHTCSNTEGSYECTCNTGYVVNQADKTKCDDVDECSTRAPCHHTCTNTDGSYECSCKTGYSVSAEDNTKCVDVDECSGSPCQQICENADGAYECSCKPGFVINPADPTRCDDVDECLDVENPPCHHNCKNTEGGYECSCRKGYSPNDCDPNTCKDIDECSDEPCESYCTNTRGGYTCA